MKSSVELLNEIMKEIGEDWKKSLDTYLKQELDEIEAGEAFPYNNLFSEFIDVYKEDVIDNKASILKQIEKIINNDLLLNRLKVYVDKLLEAYHAINPLRVLEVQDHKKAMGLIDYVFEQIVLRYNPDAKERYAEFGLEKEGEFLAVAGVLNSLSTFIVAQNLHREATVEVIRFNTRLSKEISEYVATIMDQNFENLKTKIILEMLYKKNS